MTSASLDDPVPFQMSAASAGSWCTIGSDGVSIPPHVSHPIAFKKLPAQLSTYELRGPLQIKFIAALFAMRVASGVAGATRSLYPSTQ